MPKRGERLTCEQLIGFVVSFTGKKTVFKLLQGLSESNLINIGICSVVDVELRDKRCCLFHSPTDFVVLWHPPKLVCNLLDYFNFRLVVFRHCFDLLQRVMRISFPELATEAVFYACHLSSDSVDTPLEVMDGIQLSKGFIIIRPVEQSSNSDDAWEILVQDYNLLYGFFIDLEQIKL